MTNKQHPYFIQRTPRRYMDDTGETYISASGCSECDSHLRSRDSGRIIHKPSCSKDEFAQ